MPDTDLTRWCDEQARTFRHVEQDWHSYDTNRDSALVEWVIRCLGDVGCAGSGNVVESIDRQRASDENARGEAL